MDQTTGAGKRTLAMLVVCILLAGVWCLACTTQDEPTGTTETGQTPPPAVGQRPAVSPSKDLAAVENCADLIALHEKVSQLREGGNLDPAVQTKIEEKRKALQGKRQPWAFGESLDLLALRFRRQAEGKYEISFLFLPKEKIKGNYKIGLNAYVDPAHKQHLSDPKSDLEEWTFWPNTATSDWPVGKEVLVKTLVEGKAIPYNLKMGLYANDGSPQLGVYTDVGWYADPGPAR